VPHELKERPEMIELAVSAPDREGLFRAALEGILEAVYGAPLPEGEYEGSVVPVQSAGDDDEALLEGLVEDTLRAVREEPGTLGPPRWLAFDVERVTANLPLRSPKSPSRPLALATAGVWASGDGLEARLELVPAGGG
jgi:hypothetical protein